MKKNKKARRYNPYTKVVCPILPFEEHTRRAAELIARVYDAGSKLRALFEEYHPAEIQWAKLADDMMVCFARPKDLVAHPDYGYVSKKAHKRLLKNKKFRVRRNFNVKACEVPEAEVQTQTAQA